jgi:putative dimethyl sulfoxide reductase chaperone
VKERAALYRFLAEAYLRPPDEGFLGLAKEVIEPFSASDLAGLHSWLFDFNVYPYASVYLDPSGMLNAPWSDFVAGVHRALGLELSASANLAAADHLSAELEAVAILLEREAEGTRAVAMERARHGQRTLLLEQLLPWLPIFSQALARANDGGFYGRLGELTLALALEHAVELVTAGDKAPTFAFAEAEGELPSPSVSKKGAGAARSALQALITPARSGLFLSREDIKKLARSLGLPVRFAERAFMLESLIEAADGERLSELFAALEQAAEEQLEEIVTLQGAHPKLATIWQELRRKLEGTVERLEVLAKNEVEAVHRRDTGNGHE